jgi:hypothetical protein
MKELIPFSELKLGHRFRAPRRRDKKKSLYGVKVKQFRDEAGELRNVIEVGTGYFWFFSPDIPVEVL